jgi:hypothetical protein
LHHIRTTSVNQSGFPNEGNVYAMTTIHQLDQCANCGRYGWHATERCPVACTTLVDIAAPADTEKVGPWVDELGDGQSWGRYIGGTRRATAGVEVNVCGWQNADGSVERHASVWASDVTLDAIALRRLAAVALDAADELDRLAG